MQLPSNSEFFKSQVNDKIKTYCDAKIWPFEYDRVAAWLGNFDCEIEEYLALQILNNLIVRSNDMAKASYARLFNNVIHNHLNENTTLNVGSISEWKKKLSNGTLSRDLRLGPVRLNIDEGESGSVIYRMLSDNIDTNRYSLAKAQKPPSVIILVDDFIGSGNQFLEFADEFRLSEKLEDTHIIYCPLIGFEIGVKAIKEKFPELHIFPAEIIDESDGLFFGNSTSLFKNDQNNSVNDAKTFLLGMREKYAPKANNWLGYDDVALPLAFEWGCPNQTPMLLYLNDSKHVADWQKLFSRRS